MTQMIYKKMNDVMKDIGSVTKDQKNIAQGFKFRGIDQFVNALYPALCKHGVFMAPSVVEESHELKDVTRSNGKAGIDKHVHLKVSYTFYAEDGSNVVIGPIAAEGLDSGDKATNKALSTALKYALIQTFSVPTEDMAEADLDTPEIAASTTKTTLAKAPQQLAAASAVVTLKQNTLPSGSVVGATPATTSTVASTDEAPKKVTFRKPNKAAVAPVTSNGNTGWE